MKKAPERLTAQDLVPVLVGHLEDRLVAVMPALLTRMSSRPWWSMTSWTVRRQSSAEPTLPWWMETGDLVLGELGLEGLGALAVAAVAGGDRGALGGQAAADRGADAARAAGDHARRGP